ncbi:pentapeptide repeat-containing protein [Anabaena sp. UHCC 0451]|uniref:pentapeptide repeat-containing protein n=1 Tax=Anabaena sp. UHCC 0451 TaxID=2055235 RepID=UPI002B1EC839|nr:pentapeptide repeat-containing protein [Anabaena sp. UHCC 0451]MEA5578354.1 pentapeptide repeat-containing protein [Anabaena sp. UHCC 0451]
MFNDDINNITRNWIIAALVFIISIPFLVAIYPIIMILTIDKIEVLKEKGEYIIEILKTAGLFSGGIAASINIVFAAKRAYAMEETAKAANESAKAANKNAEIAQDKQITERFAKAIEQLASDKIEVRLGAIYTLERIAKDSKQDQWTIMELLTAFVRENAPIKKEEKPQNKKPLVDEWSNVQKEKEIEELPKLRLDIQECLTVIGRREHPDPENTRLDLRNVNISKANLQGAKLQGANLEGANLEGANLEGANLEKANLEGANLEKANLRETKLLWAKLRRANLKRAILIEAELQMANLEEANLEEAELQMTNLEGANLIAANLKYAKLFWAKLGRANLKKSNLRGANLIKANLIAANITEANLKGAMMPDGSIHN